MIYIIIYRYIHTYIHNIHIYIYLYIYDNIYMTIYIHKYMIDIDRYIIFKFDKACEHTPQARAKFREVLNLCVSLLGKKT